jgi:hypothetical protein
MKDDTSRMRRRCRLARPRPARTAAVILGVGVVALLAACGSGSPSPSGAGGSGSSGGSPSAGDSGGSPSAVSYASCIRSHGVPAYPDPAIDGQLPKGDAQHFGVSPSQFQAAQQACHGLLTAGGSLAQQEAQCMQSSDCSPALVQQMRTADLRLARCMRSHGEPRFPDPAGAGSGSGSYFPISSVGISEAASRTPQFIGALNECARLVGDNGPESFG